MADFQQRGSITTLHQLRQDRLESLENELQRFRASKRLTLFLPALITEFERPDMQRICDELPRRAAVAVFPHYQESLWIRK